MSHVTYVYRERRRTPLVLLPLVLLWRLVTGIAKLTGILVALVLGVALMVLGAVLTATVVGAVIGVPLFAVGFLLFLRGLY